jgi:hypothetical protein
MYPEPGSVEVTYAFPVDLLADDRPAQEKVNLILPSGIAQGLCDLVVENPVYMKRLVCELFPGLFWRKGQVLPASVDPRDDYLVMKPPTAFTIIDSRLSPTSTHTTMDSSQLQALVEA